MSLSFIGASFRRTAAPLNTLRFLVPKNAKLHASAPSMGLEKFFDNDRGWNWDPNRPRQKYWDCATLRTKSFEDLQVIHYKTLIELNKLYSMKQEAKRFSLFFPHRARINQVKRNIKYIKLVVWERKIAYERAKAVYEAVLAENKKVWAVNNNRMLARMLMNRQKA